MHNHNPFIMGMANPYLFQPIITINGRVWPDKLLNQRQRRKLSRQTNNFKKRK